MVAVADDGEDDLFELADLILAVGRQIHAAKDDGGETWTPLEVAVMRFVDRNPGTTAGAAAEATQVISSNFSRALRGLTAKGLIRRELDASDGRRVLLFPTEIAEQNLARLRATWSRLLEGILDEPAEVVATIRALQRIEAGIADHGRAAEQTA